MIFLFLLSIISLNIGSVQAADLNSHSNILSFEHHAQNFNKPDSVKKTNLNGITAKQVLNKYILAIGGKENLRRVKDRTTYISGQVRGTHVKMIIYQKVPDKLKQVIETGSIKQTIFYEDGKGEMISANQSMELKGAELEKLKYESTMHLLLEIDSLKIKLELAGIKKEDGKPAYVVEMIFPSGSKWVQYYDTTSGLKVQEAKSVKTLQGKFTQLTEFADYKKVNGVRYPFLIKQMLGAQYMDFKVDSIKTNTGLSNSSFKIK